MLRLRELVFGATRKVGGFLPLSVLVGLLYPANQVELDPACELDVVASAARPTTTGAVLSTSLGFWGVQAALIFEAA